MKAIKKASYGEGGGGEDLAWVTSFEMRLEIVWGYKSRVVKVAGWM